MKNKRIKVQYSSRSNSSGYSMYPKIQMEGKWLEAIGFQIGDSLQVDYQNGEIHIKLYEDKPDMEPFSENAAIT
jgi:toxic protein SymE